MTDIDGPPVLVMYDARVVSAQTLRVLDNWAVEEAQRLADAGRQRLPFVVLMHVWRVKGFD